MQTIKIKAFTLVELIVVITIVWILSTVWFVSYSWYLTWARDSNRISQLTKLSDSLQVYSASKTLPLPDNKIDITASWTVIAYQWELWVDVLETIDYTNGWKDPKDDSYYLYSLSKDRREFQVLAFLEENNVSFQNTIYAVNYEDRYPINYGKKIWIILRNLDNLPVNEISTGISEYDILSDSDLIDVYFNDAIVVSWTGSKIHRAYQYNSADFSNPTLKPTQNHTRVCFWRSDSLFVIDLSEVSNIAKTSTESISDFKDEIYSNSEFNARLLIQCIWETDFYFISEQGDIYEIHESISVI